MQASIKNRIFHGFCLVLILPFLLGHGGSDPIEFIADCIEYACKPTCKEQDNGVCSPDIIISGGENRETVLSGEGSFKLDFYAYEKYSFISSVALDFDQIDVIQPTFAKLPFNDTVGASDIAYGFNWGVLTLTIHSNTGYASINELWLHSDRGRFKLLDRIQFNSVGEADIELEFAINNAMFKEGASDTHAAADFYALSNIRVISKNESAGIRNFYAESLITYVNGDVVEQSNSIDSGLNAYPIAQAVTGDELRLQYSICQKDSVCEGEVAELWLHSPSGKVTKLIEAIDSSNLQDNILDITTTLREL